MEMTNEIVAKQLKELLEETLVRGHGIFLDGGTSLLETLDAIPYEMVGRRFHGIPETIAGHVSHLIFFIRVLKEYVTGARKGATDWAESWKLREVSPTEWESLKAELRAEYAGMLGFVDSMGEWIDGDCLGGAVAIIAHCAFHLGIIRMLKDF